MRREREMTIFNFKRLIDLIAAAVFVSLLINQALALTTTTTNEPPFVTVNVVPTEGFVDETFSIYITAGDTDGYLIGAEVTLNGSDISSGFHRLNSTTWLYDYVPSTAGDYIVVCTVFDNGGATATDSATFRVTEPIYTIRPIRLSDDLLKLTDWEDFDFWANMKGSDGRDYYIDFYLVSRPTDIDISRIKFDNEPASIYFNGTHNIIEENPFVRVKAEGPITVQKLPDLVIYTLKQRFVKRWNIQWLKVEFTFQPPDLHIARASSRNGYIELKFHTRGMPFWFNQGDPFYSPSLGESMGYEIFSTVEGVFVSSGNIVQLNGYGLLEHFWADRWIPKDAGNMDFVWFHFDELYGLLTSIDDYTDGGIYLMREEQYLVVDNFSIEYLDWAYNPAKRFFVPIEISLSAITSNGTLEVFGQVQGFQHMASATEPYYNISNIRMNGTFTYLNGTIMTLTNGTGWAQNISR